jgi:hypothetical protein
VIEVADANVRIPEEAHERFAAIAADAGMSLRAYLAWLAKALPTPQERAAREQKARAELRRWSGYVPNPAQEKELDAVLDARLQQAQATGR